MHKNKQQTPDQEQHQPVLLQTVIDLLRPQRHERYLDLTAGYGGHAQAIIDITGHKVDHVLIDRDAQAISVLGQSFKSPIKIIRGGFAEVLNNLESKFDMVLADLGVSSPQLDNVNRGFSFKREAPLDMRMDQSQSLTAVNLVNTLSERELADLIYVNAEERQSRQIAKEIVANRPVTGTRQLAELVSRAYKGGRGRIHPATRTFQALRIAVNDELGQLERSLPMIEQVLNPGGRVVVISFHSLEDRLVKRFFRTSSLEPLTKKVVQGRLIDVSNPRARSAKLRAAIKNKNGYRSLRQPPDSEKTKRR